MWFRLAALGLVLSIPLTAGADTREQRLEAARGYVELAVGDMDIVRLVRSMYIPFLDQLAQQGIVASEEQRAEIDALYLDLMLEPMEQMLMRQDELMADIFTLDEIEALAEFYATPVGRSVMLKMTDLIEAQQPMVMELVEARMPILVPRVLSIMGLQ